MPTFPNNVPTLISYQKLDALQEHVDEMRSRCDDAQSELAKTSEACRVLLEKAGGLRSQRSVPD